MLEPRNKRNKRDMEKLIGVWFVVCGMLAIAWITFLIWGGIQLIELAKDHYS